MIWLAVALSLPFLWLLVVQPTLRRLAGRNVARRPIEALLVVTGSMLGTAIITGSLVVGDTIDRSIRAGAYDQLGPIDEIVSVNGLVAGVDLIDRFESFTSPDVDGVLSFMTAGASVISSGPGGGTQPRAQLLEVDFGAARSFGDDPSITGIEGDTPAAGHAVITTDLARRLHVAGGDTIWAFAYAKQLRLVVDRVVPRRGVAGYWTIDGRQQSYNLLVAPGTIASLVAGLEEAPAMTAGSSLVPPEVIVAISNVGGVESGVDRTDAASAAVNELVAPLGLRAVTTKQSLLDLADQNGKGLSQMYFTIGMFAVAAGVMLLVNIFVMLADERRSELGMLRAIGMRRSPLVAAFALEGWIYALLSSAIGALAGIGVGQLIAWRADEILGSGQEVTALHMGFAYEKSTVLNGFGLGFIISLATIVFTSIRIARFNVIRAIRDVQEPARPRPRRRSARAGLILAVLGIGYSILGFGASDGYAVMVGPAVVVAGIAPQVARRWQSRTVTTVAAAFVLVWAVAAVPVLGMMDVAIGIPIFLVQGLIMSAAAITLITVHQVAIGHAVARLSGGAPPVRLGLAYPMARRFRTAMTIGMFAIVMLTLVYMSVLSFMFRGQKDTLTSDVAGGFELVASSNASNPVQAEQLAELPGVEGVAPLGYVFADFVRSDGEPKGWPVTGIGPELVAAPPTLDETGDYATSQAAWTAVYDDPTLIIIDDNFLISAGGPGYKPPRVGDTVTIRDPQSGRSRELTVAAKSAQDLVGNGAFVSIKTLQELFGARATPSRFYVATSSPDATAAAIRSTFIVNGADADTFESLVASVLAQSSSFFTLMQQFVGAGLVVGVAGIGVIMVRAVRERRREIGVLRSLGFQAPAVARVMVFEAGFIAFEGIVTGVLIALVASYGFGATGTEWAEGMKWGVPVGEVLFIVAIAAVSTLLAALWPARRAAGIRPAAALRLAD